MKIHVELMAFIRRPDGIERIFEKEINSSTTIKLFLRELGFEPNEIRMMQFFITRTSKEESERVRQGYLLKEGDMLFITLPIGGG